MKAPKKEAGERVLIEAAQKGPRRFAELYEDNFERVYAFIARRTHRRVEAEDVTADVFHQALSNLGQFEWRGAPLTAWLLRIAANTLADRWKRAAKESGNPARDDPDMSAVTETDLEEIEQRAMLFRLVKSLPANQRRVIELRFAEEKSIREIARELGRTEGAVKQLQFRALQNLRARLGEKNG